MRFSPLVVEEDDIRTGRRWYTPNYVINHSNGPSDLSSIDPSSSNLPQEAKGLTETRALSYHAASNTHEQTRPKIPAYLYLNEEQLYEYNATASVNNNGNNSPKKQEASEKESTSKEKEEVYDKIIKEKDKSEDSDRSSGDYSRDTFESEAPDVSSVVGFYSTKDRIATDFIEGRMDNMNNEVTEKLDSKNNRSHEEQKKSRRSLPSISPKLVDGYLNPDYNPNCSSLPRKISPSPSSSLQPNPHFLRRVQLLRQTFPLFIAIFIATVMFVVISLSVLTELETTDAEPELHRSVGDEERKPRVFMHSRRLTAILVDEDDVWPESTPHPNLIPRMMKTVKLYFTSKPKTLSSESRSIRRLDRSQVPSSVRLSKLLFPESPSTTFEFKEESQTLSSEVDNITQSSPHQGNTNLSDSNSLQFSNSSREAEPTQGMNNRTDSLNTSNVTQLSVDKFNKFSHGTMTNPLLPPPLQVNLSSSPPLGFIPKPTDGSTIYGIHSEIPPTSTPSSSLNPHDYMEITERTAPIEVWRLPGGKHLCRIPNVALVDNGRIILPTWMEKYASFLARNCGLSNFVYGLIRKERKFEVDPVVVQRDLGGSYELNMSYADRDLFNQMPPRSHMPHFVSDILKPLIAAEVLMGTSSVLVKSHTLFKTKTGFMLDITPKRKWLLRPALLVTYPPNNPSEVSKTTEWVRQFIAFFEHSLLGFELVSKATVEVNEMARPTREVRILQSVMSTDTMPHEPFGLYGPYRRNVVFAANRIMRDPPWDLKSHHEIPCRVSVTALTRNGSRALLNLDVLQQFIATEAKKLNIVTDFRVMDFSEMSFVEQVRAMQSTDVLVATHGAGNANIVFMRPSSTFIEIFPFSYKAGPFDEFARIFGLRYFQAMSAPQTDVFKGCMLRNEKNIEIRDMVFRKWDQAVEKDRKSPWIHRLELEKEFGEPGKSQGMTTRSCVRLQTLKFDIVNVTDIVVKASKWQCESARRN